MKKTTVKPSGKKGRGVFAEEPIKTGEEIEDCHLILLEFPEVGAMLEGYVFNYSQRKAALALGNGSLYNHSDRPNAKAFMDKSKKRLSFEALRSIAAGEEITINYGYTKEERKRFHIV